MKYSLFFIVLLLNFIKISAQEFEYIDSLESVQINIKADFDSTYGSINTAFLPINNILIDKTLWLIRPESYDGTSNMDTLNLLKFYQIYSSIRNSHYSIPNEIYHTDSLKSKVINYDSTLVPISVIFFEYSKLKQNAFDDSLLTLNNEIIYDVPGRQDSPYESDILLAASSMRTVFSKLYISFVIDSTMFLFSNLSTQIDSIFIDFSDGYGQKQINIGDTLFALYPGNGTYIVKFSIFKNGTEYNSFSTIYIHSTSSAFILTDYLSPDLEFNLTSDIAYQGGYASGKVSVYLGCDNTEIKKPFIVLPGFDPFGSQTNEVIIYYLNGYNKLPYPCYNSFAEYLVNEAGYDLIILQYDNGSDYIQRNAFLAETLIDWVNTELEQNESDLNITLFGISMGGLVGRYALLDMESKGIDHNVQLYISGDTPHQGAHIPYPYQFIAQTLENTVDNLLGEVGSQIGGLLFGFLGDILGNFLMRSLSDFIQDEIAYNTGFDLRQILEKSIKSPAAKQMLINYFTLNFFSFPPSASYGEHSLRTQLVNEFIQMGNYPNLSKNIAISNGSINNVKQQNLEPGDPMVRWHHDAYMAEIKLYMNSNFHYSSKKDVLYFNFNYRKIRWWCFLCSFFMTKTVIDQTASLTQYPCLDCTAGGFTNINQQVVEGINSTGLFQPAGYLNRPNVAFIPTYSSLDIIKNDPQIDLIYGSLSIKDGLENASLSTPFDEYYYYEDSYNNENQNHTDFCSVSLYDVLEKEIVGGVMDVKDRTIESPHDIIMEGLQELRLGNPDIHSSDIFLVENGGRLRAFADQVIIINKDFIAEEGSNFHAKILEFPTCSGPTSKSRIPLVNDQTNNDYINKMSHNPTLLIRPNPFDDVTRVSVNLTEPSEIRLEVFDLLGNRVAIITSGEHFPIGSHDFTFSGHKHTSGVYYLKLTTNKEHISRQLLLIK
ncbi:MAG: T9SS type A sorting domain-containing protein [Bacteroidetes bacterium]|nr:T9SS type A sorting domain-containing protein [Bacteroidota bacterium]